MTSVTLILITYHLCKQFFLKFLNNFVSFTPEFWKLFYEHQILPSIKYIGSSILKLGSSDKRCHKSKSTPSAKITIKSNICPNITRARTAPGIWGEIRNKKQLVKTIMKTGICKLWEQNNSSQCLLTSKYKRLINTFSKHSLKFKRPGLHHPDS